MSMNHKAGSHKCVIQVHEHTTKKHRLKRNENQILGLKDLFAGESLFMQQVIFTWREALFPVYICYEFKGLKWVEKKPWTLDQTG